MLKNQRRTDVHRQPTVSLDQSVLQAMSSWADTNRSSLVDNGANRDRLWQMGRSVDFEGVLSPQSGVMKRDFQKIRNPEIINL